MKVGENVFILPAHSLKFGSRWGVIHNIDTDDEMPYRILFTGDNITYRFSKNELLSVRDYYDWLSSSQYVKHKASGRRLKVLGALFPSIRTDMGIMGISDLEPVTVCNACGSDTTGQLSNLCEECMYPLPKEVNENVSELRNAGLGKSATISEGGNSKWR